MSFVSMKLLLLVAAATLIYYTAGKKHQWIVLLIVSYIFYASYGVKPMVFILFTTLVTFFGGLLLEKLENDGKAKLELLKADMSKEEKKKFKAGLKLKKRMVCALVLVLSFGVLAFLKYTNFAVSNINLITGSSIKRLELLLPLGISFYTFQSAGYIIDVYQGKYKAEHNVFRYALFVSFFPQILQGPIGRFNTLAVQFFEKHDFDLENIEYAVQRMLWGYFKKLVIADRAFAGVNEIFTNYNNYTGFMVIFGVLLYCVQLYADFSGGMDVVIGIARIFGIKLDENFRQPFFSHSISEFWRRWHITLGTWMKDYVFYPFSLSKAMNRFSKFTKKVFKGHVGKVLPICLANILVFFLVGVWHGAAWKFIVYGLYNGLLIALASLFEPVFLRVQKCLHINTESRIYRGFTMVRTFILVNIGWYFDMATDIRASFVMLGNTFKNLTLSTFTKREFLVAGYEMKDMVILLAALCVWLIVSILKERNTDVLKTLSERPLVVRWALYILLIFSIPYLGFIGASTGFIYAQF